MTVSQISVPLNEKQAHALVDAVMEEDGLALTASAHEKQEGVWIFEAICDEEPDIDQFNALAQRVLGGQVSFRSEKIDPDFDWVSKSLEGLQPVIAGGFYVYGEHDAGHIPAGLTTIHIEAAQAFGTGHHETTTGCLEAIDLVLKRTSPKAMIDVGTGTGVLAIALAKRTHKRVLATDIDPVAVTTTASNAALNDVSKLVLPVQADGLHNAQISKGAPYDFIVANILAGPLVSLAPAMGRIAGRNAYIVLSGILNRQAARVISAYADHDLVLERRIIRNEWSTLLLRKKG